MLPFVSALRRDFFFNCPERWYGGRGLVCSMIFKKKKVVSDLFPFNVVRQLSLLSFHTAQHIQPATTQLANSAATGSFVQHVCREWISKYDQTLIHAIGGAQCFRLCTVIYADPLSPSVWRGVGATQCAASSVVIQTHCEKWTLIWMRPATQGSCKVFKKDEIRWWDELWADLKNWNEHVRARVRWKCVHVWEWGRRSGRR